MSWFKGEILTIDWNSYEENHLSLPSFQFHLGYESQPGPCGIKAAEVLKIGCRPIFVFKVQQGWVRTEDHFRCNLDIYISLVLPIGMDLD